LKSTELTNRCIKLRQHVLLNFAAEPWW